MAKHKHGTPAHGATRPAPAAEALGTRALPRAMQVPERVPEARHGDDAATGFRLRGRGCAVGV